MHNFERLNVWHRAQVLTVQICQAISRTRARRQRSLLNQLERSIVSIPANIAEGAGQATNPQFARFLTIAIASTNESLSHIALVESLRVLPKCDCAGWRAELLEIRMMLFGLQKSLKDRPNPNFAPLNTVV